MGNQGVSAAATLSAASAEEAREMLLRCCGCARWTERVVQRRPFASDELLLHAAQTVRGRDFTRSVTTHAVRDGVQTELIVDQPTVFVMFTRTTDVRERP